ncbi:electron transfer flavoprotein regulatory factor 1 isoform X1 [Papio anubis]|uniref:electron transfer flavoprotein regulatory factor 1 isoform X1 n=1 Tax=Papio anubis TaxID=9555 RepID=UPI0004F206ED|nr:electron transfer flavoprotein regulatory factor 1 isoform X1 [Papio anubis]
MLPGCPDDRSRPLASQEKSAAAADSSGRRPAPFTDRLPSSPNPTALRSRRTEESKRSKVLRLRRAGKCLMLGVGELKAENSLPSSRFCYVLAGNQVSVLHSDLPTCFSCEDPSIHS